MGFAPLGVAYPWDAVEPLRERARLHPEGLVDLSIGTPVDPTPQVVQEALTQASDAHGYPTVAGPVALREAIADFFARRRGVPGLTASQVLPTVGSKELVAHLPSELGLGPGDTVVIPTVAYPTYEVGARLAGARVLVSDDVEEWRGDPTVRLVWVNSPANPSGRVLGVDHLRAVVAAAREIGAVVASDECYALLPWAQPWVSEGVPSILDPRVSGGESAGLLAVYSLSKQSNLAGYRAAFVAGDERLIDPLLQLRRHRGMMLPAPVQHAMVRALGDDAHVTEQVARYAERRALLAAALPEAGCEIEDSEAGLYLWIRAAEGTALPEPAPGLGPEACWSLMTALADQGILAGPGIFYGSAGADHVRVSLTAPTPDVERAAARLRAGLV